MRLIDADALTENLQKERASVPNSAWLVGYNAGVEKAIDCTQFAKIVDAVPVVHGKWQEIRNAYGELEGWLCECGREVKCKENYCPNCGAKMDGGRV